MSLLSDEERAKIKGIAVNAVKAVAPLAVGALAHIALRSATATNYKESDITGDKDMKPTEDKTALQQKESNGNKVEGNLSSYEVAGQDGKVNAAQTDAKASRT